MCVCIYIYIHTNIHLLFYLVPFIHISIFTICSHTSCQKVNAQKADCQAEADKINGNAARTSARASGSTSEFGVTFSGFRV